MIRNKLTVMAKEIIINKDSNNASIIEIIDEITSPAFPLVLPEISVLSHFYRDEGDISEFFVYVDFSLNRESLGRLSGKISFGEQGKARLITNMTSLTIPSPGELVCKVSVKETEDGEDIAVNDHYINVNQYGDIGKITTSS